MSPGRYISLSSSAQKWAKAGEGRPIYTVGLLTLGTLHDGAASYAAYGILAFGTPITCRVGDFAHSERGPR
jgi:hypothetical protein